jgi:hypothetical protein
LPEVTARQAVALISPVDGAVGRALARTVRLDATIPPVRLV